MRIIMLSAALVAAMLLSLSGCASKERTQGATEQEIYEVAQRYLNSRNWLNAIQALQLLEENFPFGNYGEQAQLELIYAHYEAGNYEASVATANRFIRLHPQHRNADYAYYMRGLASFHQEKRFMGSVFGGDHTNRDPGAARDSFDHFAEFIRRFPNSPYALDAQQRMIYLRNVLARAEIHVANYYFKRGAYLAAANRGNYVVQHFQTTPAVPDALAVMAQAYYLLGFDDLAEDAVEVLAANFPDHPALDSQGRFDDRYVTERGKRSWVSYVTLGLFDRIETRGFDTREMYDGRTNLPPPQL